MSIRSISTRPFRDQKPGTAGLRKPVRQFQQEHYLENFIQSVFDSVPALKGGRLVIGGDGRFYNREAATTLIRMAVANGVREILLGAGALLSTPAAAHLIAREDADGGFLLTASHNPGGPEGDFGIKFNIRGGGQASAELTDRIHAASLAIQTYRLAELEIPSLDQPGEYRLLDTTRLRILDPVTAHADLMASCFDFPMLARWLEERPGRFAFDAMHAVTGPYAREIFVQRLGADEGMILNSQPREDFGGGHPDPNPVDAAGFIDWFGRSASLELGAASDGDGDRNMILGPGQVVSPCDSLAVICANHAHIPGLKGRLRGVARSMPTSRALDAVARELGIPCHETPTGWRFFASLLEAGRIQLCGEESFGTSSDHVREKDGLWAVLAWMQIMAARGMGVDALLKEHWQRFGRHYYARHDFNLPAEQGDAVMQGLEAQAARGHFEDCRLDRFDYTDPVSGHSVTGQGIRCFTPEDGRIVFRLSGTGTRSATLRIYLEQYAAPNAILDLARDRALSELSRLALRLAALPEQTGKTQADTVI